MRLATTLLRMVIDFSLASDSDCSACTSRFRKICSSWPCDPSTVAGLFQKGTHLEAPAATSVIVSVIRENHNLQIASFPCLVTGTQILKLPVKPAEHEKNVAIQILGVIRRANVGVVVRARARGFPKFFGHLAHFVFIRVQRKKVAHARSVER